MLIERKRSISEQQQSFIDYLVKENKNPTESARLAGYAHPKQSGSRNAQICYARSRFFWICQSFCFSDSIGAIWGSGEGSIWRSGRQKLGGNDNRRAGKGYWQARRREEQFSQGHNTR